MRIKDKTNYFKSNMIFLLDAFLVYPPFLRA